MDIKKALNVECDLSLISTDQALQETDNMSVKKSECDSTRDGSGIRKSMQADAACKQQVLQDDAIKEENECNRPANADLSKTEPFEQELQGADNINENEWYNCISDNVTIVCSDGVPLNCNTENRKRGQLEGRMHKITCQLENIRKRRENGRKAGENRKRKLRPRQKEKEKKKERKLNRLVVCRQFKRVKDKLKNCIVIEDFPQSLAHKEILKYFKTCGKVVKYFFRNDNRYAIIEFRSSTSINELLSKDVILEGTKLEIKPANHYSKEIGMTNILQFKTFSETLKDLPDFETQLNKLIEQVQPNCLTQKYKILCADLQDILQKIFPGCVVFPFGAAETGLGFTTSVVDIHVEVFKETAIITETAGTSRDSPYQKENYYINKSKNLLQKHNLIFLKVPLDNDDGKVECIHTPTKLKCDFYFTKWMSVRNTSLIRYYLSLHNKLKPLMIIIKYWGKVHELIGTPYTFSNYSLTLLLIFYLQQSPYLLPSVMCLQESHRSVNGSWNTEFNPLEHFISEPLSRQTISEVLHGFFYYYAHFDYLLKVICPYLGKPVPKTECFNTEFLADIFPKNKSERNNTISSIYLQDPFKHNDNITIQIPQTFLRKFIGLCKLGADIFRYKPVSHLALYRLFTDTEIRNIPQTKPSISGYNCRFAINMTSNLEYLSVQINKNNNALLNPAQKLNEIRKAWCNLVNNFVFAILTDLMKFTVDVEDGCPDNKSQRLNEQADVHDTDLRDFRCSRSGTYNIQDAKNEGMILKGIKLDDQTKLIKLMCLEQFILHNLTLHIKMDAKKNRTEMIVILNHVMRYKEPNFKGFAKFFSKKVPIWFREYINELDKSLWFTNNKNIPEKLECVHHQAFRDDEFKEEKFGIPLQIKSETENDPCSSENVKLEKNIKPEPVEPQNNETVQIKFESEVFQNDITVEVVEQIKQTNELNSSSSCDVGKTDSKPESFEQALQGVHNKKEIGLDNCINDGVSEDGRLKYNICNEFLTSEIKREPLDEEMHKLALPLQTVNIEIEKHGKSGSGRPRKERKNRRDRRKNAALKKLSNSILIKDFPPSLMHKEILQYFSTREQIVDYFFRGDNQYGIIKFHPSTSINELLSADVILQGTKLEIKPANYYSKEKGLVDLLDFQTFNETLKDLPDFQTQLNKLIDQVQPTWLAQNYKLLCTDLQNMLQKIFPGCIVSLFGAAAMGLGFTTSIVDIQVKVFNEGAGTSRDSQPQKNYTYKSKNLLEEHKLIFVTLHTDEQKVACIHCPTELQCYFYFEKRKSVPNTSLIRYYLSLDNKLKPLMIIIKYWAKIHGLTGAMGGGAITTNYALTLLFIFYLQQSPYLLPPVISLQVSGGPDQTRFLNTEYTPLEHFVSESLSSQTIPEILHGFFDYYAHFDFLLNVICPYLGKPIPKTEFLNPEFVADKFSKNVSKRLNSFVYVQDPFKHDNNVTFLLRRQNLGRFVGMCKLGTDIFKNLPVDHLGLYRLFTDSEPPPTSYD